METHLADKTSPPFLQAWLSQRRCRVLAGPLKYSDNNKKKSCKPTSAPENKSRTGHRLTKLPISAPQRPNFHFPDPVQETAQSRWTIWVQSPKVWGWKGVNHLGTDMPYSIPVKPGGQPHPLLFTSLDGARLPPCSL